MAEFRVDQATPGSGTPGRSRHDLIPGEVITLVATSPTGGGVTYTWEILDKVGSTAVLSATTGASVTIGLAGAITQPCAFLIRLTANDGGNVTVTDRIASVRSLVAGLRAPLFPETAPTTNKLSANTPDSSTDNADYANRAGLGASGQNWRGWGEWAYEVVLAVEAAFGGGGPPSGPASGDLAGTYPSPTVDGIQGRAVVATLPTNGQVYAWNSGTLQWEPVTISGSPSGPASGDLAGTYPSPTVDAIQGVTVSAAAPSNGQVFQYNSGTLQWEPTTITTASPSTFVYRQGGIAAGNVYTTWASLYAAVNAVSGPKVVQIDDASGTPEISAGAFNLTDWVIVGAYDGVTRPTLTVRTGVTLSFGHIQLQRIVFLLDAGASSPWVGTGTDTLVVDLLDADFDGGLGNNLVVPSLGDVVRCILRGESRILNGAILVVSGGTISFDIYDRSRLDDDAFVGSGPPITIRAIDNETVILEAFTYAGTINIETPQQVFNGPLDGEQFGTTELHVGSVYLTQGTRVLSSSAAMLGGSVVSETGVLKMRRFTGGTLITTWSNTGTLADTQLGAAVLIANTDWYDLYLAAGGGQETAIVKGLRLLAVKES